MATPPATSGKSSTLMEVKPWGDETDMKELEAAVRAVQMEGLLWGASELVPDSNGIYKMMIMLTIVDALVSVDDLIKDYLTAEPINEYVQSCDIIGFKSSTKSNLWTCRSCGNEARCIGEVPN